MKSIIYKYTIRPDMSASHDLVIPMEGEFLKAEEQRGVIVLWYKIPLNHLETSDFRKYLTVWTGELFDSHQGDKYLGTVTINALVWHIFDITERERD
jgi:hypothetical protein